MVTIAVLITCAVAFVILALAVVAHANTVVATVAIATIAAHTLAHLLAAVAVILVFVIDNNKMSAHSRKCCFYGFLVFDGANSSFSLLMIVSSLLSVAACRSSSDLMVLSRRFSSA